MFSASGASFENLGDLGPSAQFPPNEAFAGLPGPSTGSVPAELEGEASSENSIVGVVGRTAASNVPSPSHPPHQHASLFYLSLIEGRCRTQATNLVNSRRRPEDQLPEDHSDICKVAESLFAEMSKELLRAGLLPQQVAVPTFHELRRYLASFDTILNNIAIQQPPGTFEDSTYRAIEASNTFAFSSSAVSSLFERSQSESQSQSQALIARRFNMPHLNLPQAGSPSSLRSTIFPEDPDEHLRKCLYDMKFKQICRLGKGGYGKVYSALHILDGQEYAIKKIPISANRLNSILHNEMQAAELLSELRALAKLQHRNVVRYYDSWLEARSACKRNTKHRQRQLDTKAYASQVEDSDSEDSESPSSLSNSSDESAGDFQNLKATQESELKKEVKWARKGSMQDSANSSNIIFENSCPSTSNVTQQSNRSSESQSTFNNLFRKPTDDESDEESDDDEHDTEEVERNATGFELSQDKKRLMIFIQMAQYPMTLEDFIWPNLERGETATNPTHCFHTMTTARILLSILDGIEYIHSQHIVHRDLKPPNIFLTVSKSREGLEGSINLKACPECSPSSSAEHVCIIPHIGDFGLIAKLDEPSPAQPSQAGFSPSPLAIFSSIASGNQPGTILYRAPKNTSSTICPKLDVYSLGVIAVELSKKFGTRTERVRVLNNDPSKMLDLCGLASHPMAPGIRGMLCTEVDGRWGCGKVREWLLGVLGKY
ncbi:uncharacterized protein BP5553_10130 [Venustampulla echinocandica]|uniref:non-specific serine/threonine protein kinase n=1 Tax=Venustampulla echinocandica TaxID=2656787 RepID=A0A370TAG5_9HELO|nr:uncharacterized protein BP5553_10130 [Venustampulla echinocandica]RDL30785.1 hypothetical protein BP5553_10130 [Venustampulla echinocandica]